MAKISAALAFRKAIPSSICAQNGPSLGKRRGRESATFKASEEMGPGSGENLGGLTFSPKSQRKAGGSFSVIFWRALFRPGGDKGGTRAAPHRPPPVPLSPQVPDKSPRPRKFSLFPPKFGPPANGPQDLKIFGTRKEPHPYGLKLPKAIPTGKDQRNLRPDRQKAPFPYPRRAPKVGRIPDGPRRRWEKLQDI
jgi:hypothetical protein